MTTTRADSSRPVLILGAGINGCAVARELALNGVPVWLVDSGDIARGATSRSSRLIHGGLRYLEYRDIALVQESLIERERLLRLAPQFVTPLRLSIPVSGWFGGLVSAALRFTRLAGRGFSFSLGQNRRGLLAVRLGLFLYDWLTARALPATHKRASCRRNQDSSERAGPRLNRRTFRWICEYSDAQMIFPERFVLALLADARQAAQDQGVSFEVRTWSDVSREGDRFLICGHDGSAEELTPRAVVNATGAWGDLTLKSLDAEQPPLFAGTKGSHLYSTHAGLRDALGGNGIYAEAADGRLVFILPCGKGTLIGTTDLPFADSPGEAVADESEIDYLLEMVNCVFDSESVALTPGDVEMRHAGVRPLPRVEAARTAAIPRGHSIESSQLDGVEVLTLIGGKLTTCRALAEEVAKRVLAIHEPRQLISSESRIVPGGEDWPASPPEMAQRLRQFAQDSGLSDAQAETVWKLIGNRFEVLPEFLTGDDSDSRQSLTGTDIPLAFVRWSIRNEYVARLEDLIERRLMLTFSSRLCRETLQELAEELLAAGRLNAGEVQSAIDEATERLRHYYGKSLTQTEPDRTPNGHC